MGKVNHWEFAKNLNLTIQTNGICTFQNPSWRMRWANFPEILRWLDLMIVKKKKSKKRRTCQIMNFVPCGPLSANKRKRKKKPTLTTRPCLRPPPNKNKTKQTNDNNNYGIWKWRWYQLLLMTSNNTQRIGIETGRHGNKRTSRDHSDYGIKIGQNTKKVLGDLRSLAVTQTPERNHLLTLVRKTPKGV